MILCRTTPSRARPREFGIWFGSNSDVVMSNAKASLELVHRSKEAVFAKGTV